MDELERIQEKINRKHRLKKKTGWHEYNFSIYKNDKSISDHKSLKFEHLDDLRKHKVKSPSKNKNYAKKVMFNDFELE